MRSLVQIKKLGKKFPAKREPGSIEVLKELNFEIPSGKITVIVGRSGVGKTTILNILSGLDKDYDGSIITDGKNKVGYVFQDPLLLPWRTIRQNVELGLEIQRLQIDQKQIESLLKEHGLELFSSNYPSSLSGGMRQRVALLRTLVTNPTLLLLDEPFSSLDYESKLALEEGIFNSIAKKGMTAVLVTHDIEEAVALGDRIIVIGKRPARIIDTFEIRIGRTSPIKRRQDEKFKEYFNRIWEGLKG